MRGRTIACLLLVASCMCERRATAEATMRDGDTAFAAALHAQLRTHAGNLFYSPASVRIALAMAAVGARDATRAELWKALALPAGPDAARAIGAQLADWEKLARPTLPSTPSADSDMQKWQQQLLEQKRVVLRVVNRIWAQQGHHFVAEFTDTLREQFHAPLGTVDFQHAAEAARESINRWVNDATEGKIPSLIAPRQLTPATKMVLTNAVYFKAKWQEPFQGAFTRDEPFFVADARKVTVPMMHRIGYESLARVDGALVLERPYGDGRLVMDIVLPTAKDGLGKIEDAYARGALTSWLSALGHARVDVTLPKFKSSSSLSLVPVLRALGIVHATEYPGADFSGIDGTHELFIGAVIHQAVVDVDENGTEAAAATAVAVAAGAAPRTEEPVPFRADHPFLYVIRDASAGVVLFAGRLADPSLK